MMNDHTLTLIIRLLEDCLEHDYSAEELHSKVHDILRLLNGGNEHEMLEGSEGRKQ